MDKKGFTLVELLGVIIILTLLALISSRAIMKTVKSSKQDLTNTQKENIKSAVYFWIEDNLTNITVDNNTGCTSNLSLDNFNGYLNTSTLSSDIINSGNISIKICKNDSNDVSYNVEIIEGS